MNQAHLDEFYSFLRFASISTDDHYAGELNRCAEWLVRKFQRKELRAESIATKKHPVVWARALRDSKKRTVLIYGHYDVQPPDPIEMWDSPPFEPVLKNGYVFARGATDNKGQVLAHVLGVEEILLNKGELPVNVHFVVEGEEEIGSPSLPAFLEENRDQLRSDVAIVSDSEVVGRRANRRSVR